MGLFCDAPIYHFAGRINHAFLLYKAALRPPGGALFGVWRSEPGRPRPSNDLAAPIDCRASRPYRRGGLLAISSDSARRGSPSRGKPHCGYAFTRTDGRRAPLEIVGFWTPEYIKAKLKALALFAGEPLRKGDRNACRQLELVVGNPTMNRRLTGFLLEQIGFEDVGKPQASA